MDDDDHPRMRGDAATRLAGESLDSHSRDELDARIALLEAEIVRVKTHRDQARSHMAAAEALFNRASSGSGAQ